MFLRPFILLLVLVLAWALIPPTLCRCSAWFRYCLASRVGREIRPTPGYIVRQWHFAYLFLAVAFGWSTLFLFYPLVKSLIYSFTDKSIAPGAETSWVGMQNFVRIMSDPLWWKSILVTIVFIVGTLPYSVFISLFLASLIVNLSLRWQTFFKAALYLPGVTSLVVSAAIMRWIFHPGDGFANMILRQLGLISQNMLWFSDPELALPTIIVMTWLGVNGLAVIIYCAALGGIPRDYYEAADIDGASSVRKFLHITWPLVKPATIYVVITGLIGGFQVFAPAMLITGGGPKYTTHFVNYRIYQTFFYANQFGLACAMCVILMIIIVTISFINYRFLATDVEY